MSSAAEIVGSIDDLLKEILLRLPLKSLVRFESISNHWYNLITILRSFLISNQNPNPTGLIFLVYKYKPYVSLRYEYVPFSLDPDHDLNNSTPIIPSWNQTTSSQYIIAHSCNGLHLMHPIIYTRGHTTYYVCNPTTNNLIPLPPPDCRVERMFLAFDPAKSPYYKVACVGMTSPSGPPYQVYIYSSDTHCWRKRGEPFTVRRHDFKDAVYWNGNINWLDAYDPEEYFYFDIQCQMVKRMPRPPLSPGITLHSTKYYFGETSDHLYFVPILSLQFNVYELKRDYSEWFIKYHVDLSMLPSLLDWGDFSVISVIHGAYNKDDPFLIVGHPPNETRARCTRYNIVSKTCQTLQVLDGTGGIINVFPYMESLCSV